MEGISDIKIIGIDEKRPPQIRKEPYINLFFKLIHEAPKKWCEDFNQLVSNGKYPAKIKPAEGLFIETWVRKPEEIAERLTALKAIVERCTQEYIANIQAQVMTGSDQGYRSETEGEQGRLNRIIAELNYDS